MIGDRSAGDGQVPPTSLDITAGEIPPSIEETGRGSDNSGIVVYDGLMHDVMNEMNIDRHVIL